MSYQKQTEVLVVLALLEKFNMIRNNTTCDKRQYDSCNTLTVIGNTAIAANCECESCYETDISVASYMGYSNEECPYYPCHSTEEMENPNEFNCLFCYCPLYWLECPGIYTVLPSINGVIRKDCSGCLVPHDGYCNSWSRMVLSDYQTHPVIWNKNNK